MTNYIKKLFFFFIFVLSSSCSFDSKTGIWSGSEEERRKALELEQLQKRELIKIYSSRKEILKEIKSTKNISLSTPKNNASWKMQDSNLQNFIGNNFLSGIDNNFLKKKIGKNKFEISKIMSSPVVLGDKVILADDTGTIFAINLRGKIIWKKNIYKKLYKKIYKNLSFAIYKDKIYVSDNIGFVY